MYQQAARDLNLDLERCVVVGDKVTDLLPGIALGCRTILVRTGYGQSLLDAGALDDLCVDHIAGDLLDAANWILTRPDTQILRKIRGGSNLPLYLKN